MKYLIVLTAIIFGSVWSMPSQATSMFEPGEWQGYLDAFVSQDGRVIDAANGRISHSEGQGYGLLLGVLAEDRGAFERIWSFTTTELLVRDDGLAAWRWEPDSKPHIVDPNNATDGDILIAYALYRAGQLWNEPSYTDTATAMIKTIGRTLLINADGLPAILPGAVGFGGTADRPEPVLNPSYWVFEALPLFGQIDAEVNWRAVGDTGVEILRRAAANPVTLPPDWLVLEGGALAPAPDFPAEYGYNNIRIPLYLMRAGMDPALLAPFRSHADAAGLYKIDVTSGAVIEPISEPGYRLIQAAMECVAAGTRIPEALTIMSPTSYYAATLQLLLLDYLRRSHAACMGGTVP